MNNKLPFAASEYIRTRFRDEFLFEVKEFRQGKGHWNFFVEVTKDSYIHKLYFDDNGALLKEESDPAFPGDPHDGPVEEEAPE